MGTKIPFRKPEGGFKLVPAGEQPLKITAVTAMPRVNPTMVSIDFVHPSGARMTNRYNLDKPGGYAALYYLLTNACGIDPETEEVDLDSLVGKYVLVEISHREGDKLREDGTPMLFANITRAISPAEPFEVEGDDDTANTAGSSGVKWL